MTIFFYQGLTRNPEIGNTPVWVLPNIWRLGRVMDTKFGTNSVIGCYWMLQNSRVTASTVFELLMKNQLGGGGKIIPPIRIKLISQSYCNLLISNQVIIMIIIIALRYYTNIKQGINQREFGSFILNLSRSYKCSLHIFLTYIYTDIEKLMKLHYIKLWRKICANYL